MRAGPSEFGRHGNGTYGDIGTPVPTEIGYSVPTRGGSKGSNLCRSGGLHARGGNPRERKSGNMDCAVLEGATFRDRWIAQACNCVPLRIAYRRARASDGTSVPVDRSWTRRSE